MSQIKQIPVPDIGQFKSVEVIEVNVKEGDAVKKNQTLITLESDKASMEIPAPEAGVVEKIVLKVGDKVAQGTIILSLRTTESVADKAAPAKAAAVAHAPEVKSGPTEQAVYVPDIGNFKSVAVIEINVAPGAKIKKDDTIVTLESDKASMEIPSPYTGVVQAVQIKVGDKVGKGDLILTMMAEATATPAPRAAAASASRAAPATASTRAKQPLREITTPGAGPLYTSPAVRRMARDLEIDLHRVAGTGRKGRIQPEDLYDHVKTRMEGSGGGLGVAAMPEVDFSSFGAVETQELSRIKKLSASYLHRNWVMIPHVTQFDEADITDLEALRKAKQADAEKHGVKLTMLSFLLKAIIVALKKFPQFNSSLAPNGSEIILKKYYHIGVAVDTPQGLVVPIIRDVDQKSLYELAKELAEISQKARDGKLTGKELQGGTFTISSLGGVGGTAFTPIINAPDVAILGVSRSALKPVYQDDKFVPRLMLPLSLSYDHRVIDGVEGARFTTYLREVLGNMEFFK